MNKSENQNIPLIFFIIVLAFSVFNLVFALTIGKFILYYNLSVYELVSTYGLYYAVLGSIIMIECLISNSKSVVIKGIGVITGIMSFISIASFISFITIFIKYSFDDQFINFIIAFLNLVLSFTWAMCSFTCFTEKEELIKGFSLKTIILISVLVFTLQVILAFVGKISSYTKTSIDLPIGYVIASIFQSILYISFAFGLFLSTEYVGNENTQRNIEDVKENFLKNLNNVKVVEDNETK